MNFSSILNNDPPAEKQEVSKETQRPQQQQRHSLVNLLNDSNASTDPVRIPSSDENGKNGKGNNEANDTYKTPKPAILSPSTSARAPLFMKRNSIANITNDTDIDITTGKETLNASHQQPEDKSEASSPPEQSNQEEIIEKRKEEEEEEEEEVELSDGDFEDVEKSSEHPNEVEEEETEDIVVDEGVDDNQKPPVLDDSKSSTDSVKTNLNKWKPTRYTVPPIWAQEWIPGSQAQNGSGVNEVVSATESAISSKHVFENSNLVSLDLECSITGTIPPPSLTRTVAEWIYANFTEIPEEKRKYIELELKFGTLIDKRSGHRLKINVSTECIYTDVSNINFELGVHEVGFNILCKFLEDLEKNYQDDLRKHPNKDKPRRKFNMLESDITDTFFQIIQRNEPVSKIRISKDNLLSPPRYIAINKQRISDLYIHNPSSMYDLRLSLSYENPVPENEIDSIRKRNQPSLTRIKKRSSWSHRQTVTRFDMTRVLTPRELKNKVGKKIIEQNQSFEVELEIDTHELFSGFDKFKSGQDVVRFEELVEIFLNNGRSMNNRVTKIANK